MRNSVIYSTVELFVVLAALITGAHMVMVASLYSSSGYLLIIGLLVVSVSLVLLLANMRRRLI